MPQDTSIAVFRRLVQKAPRISTSKSEEPADRVQKHFLVFFESIACTTPSVFVPMQGVFAAATDDLATTLALTPASLVFGLTNALSRSLTVNHILTLTSFSATTHPP